MSESQSQYLCPACKRGIIDRKVDYCLFCSATLPAELLYTPEQIAAMDAEESKMREKGLPFATGNSYSDGAADGASLLGDIVDIALSILDTDD